MKKVYEAENPVLVWSARILVEEAGIPCTIRNEFAAAANGLLAPIETWPELWVEERHSARALALLAGMRSTPRPESDWTCQQCGERNAFSFEFCWHCQAAAAPG